MQDYHASSYPCSYASFLGCSNRALADHLNCLAVSGKQRLRDWLRYILTQNSSMQKICPDPNHLKRPLNILMKNVHSYLHRLQSFSIQAQPGMSLGRSTGPRSTDLKIPTRRETIVECDYFCFVSVGSCTDVSSKHELIR